MHTDTHVNTQTETKLHKPSALRESPLLRTTKRSNTQKLFPALLEHSRMTPSCCASQRFRERRFQQQQDDLHRAVDTPRMTGGQVDPVRMSQDTFQRSLSQSENEKKLLVLSERAEARESQGKSTNEEVSCSGSEVRCSRNQHGVLKLLERRLV